AQQFYRSTRKSPPKKSPTPSWYFQLTTKHWRTPALPRHSRESGNLLTSLTTDLYMEKMPLRQPKDAMIQ
ncbi:MAG TPA: hypothetical protein PK231_13660, partial [Acidocella sp.]|nr:hypothetical protein [Acidocella sp.]